MTVTLQNTFHGIESTCILDRSVDSTRIVLSECTSGNRDITALYDDLIGLCMKDNMSDADLTRLCDAVAFAAEKHKDQCRKDIARTPYIIHPIGVAYSIAVEGGYTDVDTLIGAILHDTVEDTDTKYDELSERFGEEISGYVKECSDEVDEVTGNKIYGKKERKRQQVAHASGVTAQAKLIKLGDKLYNLRDMPKDVWSPALRYEYLTFVDNIVKAIISGHENVQDVRQLQAIEQLEGIAINEIQRIKEEIHQEVSADRLVENPFEDWG
jgi:(p)ppGpp synthase/HD superfamily hydrolase